MAVYFEIGSNSDVTPFAMRDYILYRWIGVWLFVLPFLGIPGNWKEALLILTAFFIVGYSFVKHREVQVHGGEGVAGERTEDIQPRKTATNTRSLDAL